MSYEKQSPLANSASPISLNRSGPSLDVADEVVNSGKRYRLLIKSSLPPNSQLIAAGIVQLWRLLAGSLKDVIGEMQFVLLYKRSIGLTVGSNPLILKLDTVQADIRRLKDSKACLCAENEVVAPLARVLVLASFLELVGAIIGEDLTLRIAGQAWAQGATGASSTDELQASLPAVTPRRELKFDRLKPETMH
jgi:hypothetical protein